MPKLDNYVFRDVDCPNGTLYVPEEAYDAYVEAEQWKDWGTIIKLPKTNDNNGGNDSNGNDDNEEPNDINKVISNTAKNIEQYSIDGTRSNQRGFRILKMEDGTVKKVYGM